MNEISDVLQTVGPKMNQLSEEFRNVSLVIENTCKELRLLNQTLNSLIALEDEITLEDERVNSSNRGTQ